MEGLKRLESSIVAIRNAVKFVRSSPSLLSYFKMCVETEKIECKGLVVMDVPTRWNSTYLMLDAALKFRKAFDRMGDDPDSSYLMYFKEDEGDDERIEVIEGSGKGKGKSKSNKRVGPPNDEDWEKAVTFVMFLKTFYDVTLKISASLHPSSHSTFHDLLAIDGEIRELYRYDATIPIEERTAMDTLLNDMAASMKKKYDKYWGWWRINGLKYPTLASIANDVLAIPTSTIASESCFSTSGRVIDSFRSSLSPRMVEALICSQNWIRSEDISSLQYVPSIEEMEFYESIEMGCFVKAFGRMDAADFLQGYYLYVYFFDRL
ncbi:PREDICTED: zinc finger BED domain-containing protein RICESLEEPER 2-like [Prunus mume]|uniref:Zinc finger BED domain-containing protein RICESLEEPER 2-like n=1 Tax=Prunus mume TaxID=102107 RepID=A0ABM1LYZ1_PRUMU|nr:PREDICTED: zinc finger BED domain-containing protein RICESLEEPER 2-like [Prunus mume]